LVVSLPEACQTLLWVVWCGLLLLGGAAEEPHPLSFVSSYHSIDKDGAYEVHGEVYKPHMEAVKVGDVLCRCSGVDAGRGRVGSSSRYETNTVADNTR
tara:strand:+ start:247 stop:540 length:294 start_codon:yes stop_codon:yes gene_type:complete